MRYVNIGFQDGIYKKIEDLVKRREISRFVNQAVEEKIQKQEQEIFVRKQKERAELRKRLIEEYKESVKNRSLEEKLTLRAAEEASLEDVFTSLEKKERKSEQNK